MLLKGKDWTFPHPGEELDLNFSWHPEWFCSSKGWAWRAADVSEAGPAVPRGGAEGPLRKGANSGSWRSSCTEASPTSVVAQNRCHAWARGSVGVPTRTCACVPVVRSGTTFVKVYRKSLCVCLLNKQDVWCSLVKQISSFPPALSGRPCPRWKPGGLQASLAG